MTNAVAQEATRYVYFPSPRVDDGRFLSMAGSNLNTLGEDIVLKLAIPSNVATIEIGIFDGETGGRWDMGTLPMTYSLYADPNGDGAGTVKLKEWSGSQMPDNAWFSDVLPNSSAARGPHDNYFYKLVIHNPDISVANVWSNFKIRTSGTVVALLDRPFAYTAPLNSLSDAQTIYPNYPTLTNTTYDGSWSFYLYLKSPATSLTVWDGDMDYGSYDCSVGDNDDPDTPNGLLPEWAPGTMAVLEGLAGGGINCVDANGTVTSGKTTSNPADDARNVAVRRSPNVTYEVVTPDGRVYVNDNPSGNLEWESFRLSVDPFDRNAMDHHVETLPAGVYEVRIKGVDMSNLNAWRFPLDALGVDTTGEAVLPILPDLTDGSVAGSIYYESSGNVTQDAGEPGIPTVTVQLAADYNGDNAIDERLATETDTDGHYNFGSLKAGKYTVSVDLGTLSDDVTPMTDPDGVATPSSATCSLSVGQKTMVQVFGYKRVSSTGTRTRGYWVNHPENWPVTMIRLGDVYYSQEEALGILKRPTKGDVTYSMAAQLIATKLNLADGCDGSCIINYVADADEWISAHPLGSKPKGTVWTVDGNPVHNKLDDYNNGRLCEGHMN
jgi:hypothetical protein